ncbi:MAG TPA: heme o synthase [Thermoanaerobaculia bacterium]|nr:heme o synthase [Thermoanaerobaculia bacterium]
MEVVGSASLASAPSRAADFLELAKPRITFLVVVTAAVGYALGAAVFQPGAFLAVLFGTALVAGGASALNQHAERDFDARMLRTRGRPLPSGRLAPGEALSFGLAISSGGLAVLSLGTNWLTVALGLAALVSYVFAYTPLKRVTSLCTVVGAVPGAIPPVMGWAAARGTLDRTAWALFAILALWQLPHFLALSWIYREDYARAGFPMLAVSDEDGASTGRQALLYAAALLPVTLAAGLFAQAGAIFLVGALGSGLAFLACAAAFARRREISWARRLFLASVLHLPTVLCLMVFDR